MSMGKEHEGYSVLFSNLASPMPAEALLIRILFRIEEARQRRARIRMSLVCALAATSTMSLVVSGVYAVREIVHSNVSSYLSLLFSDTSSLMLIWKEFGLSLVDSVPLWGLTLLCATVLALLLSIRLGVRYTSKYAQFA